MWRLSRMRGEPSMVGGGGRVKRKKFGGPPVVPSVTILLVDCLGNSSPWLGLMSRCDKRRV